MFIYRIVRLIAGLISSCISLTLYPGMLLGFTVAGDFETYDDVVKDLHIGDVRIYFAIEI